MILIPNNNPEIVYIFLHGAYDTPWGWSYIIDELYYKNKCTSILFYLDDYNGIVEFILNNISTSSKLKLVGFSLGALIAIEISQYLSKKYHLELFLVSTPIINPSSKIVTTRLIIDTVMKSIHPKIDRRFYPLFLRGKIMDKNSTFLIREMVKENYMEFIKKAIGCKKINISSGRFDYVSGGIKKQKELCEQFSHYGMESSFFNLGLVGHFPYLFNRKRLVGWLLDK